MSEHRIHSIPSSEIAKSANFNLEERLRGDEKPITAKELGAYADAVILELKKLKKLPDRKSLLQKIYSKFVKPEKFKRQIILDEIVNGQLADKELDEHLIRIRAALAEEIKKRLAQEPELEDLLYGDINITTSKLKDHLKQAQDLNSKKKMTRNVIGSYSRKDMLSHQVAMQKLMELPEHEGIVKLQGVDNRNKVSLIEHRDLINLQRSLEKGSVNLVDALRIVADCLDAADYLKQNDLVLQDISLDNLGVVNDSGSPKGVLFDFDGLYVSEMKIRFPITHGGRYEARKPSEKVMPQEMTMQFGACLFRMINEIPQFRAKNLEQISLVEKEVTYLVDKMVEYDEKAADPYHNRISLSKAKKELEGIIRFLENLPAKKVGSM